MENRVAKPAARFVGAFLLVMALLGLINNPLIGQDVMRAADTPMIIAYALAGAALLGDFLKWRKYVRICTVYCGSF